MTEERAIYHIDPQPEPDPKQPVQQVVRDISFRVLDNLLWLIDQLEEHDQKKVIEKLIKAKSDLVRKTFDNMDNIRQGVDKK